MIDVVDFFCGCGGTSAGFRQAGMNIVAGIDFDLDAGKTFRRNFPEAKFFQKDIRSLLCSDLKAFISHDRERPLLFSACAPCQPFTKQKTTRPEKDERITLLDEFHRFVRALRPDLVFLENVPGLQKIDGASGPLGRFLSLLEELGYRISYDAPRSGDYGVPQIRKRLVLIASLLDDVVMPDPTHGPLSDVGTYKSVWECISDLPELAAGEQHSTVPNHRAARLSELNLRRIEVTPEGGGRLDWPPDLRLNCHKKHTGHTDVYGRLMKHSPAAALSTRCISLSNGRFGHPTQNRALSVREAARLQTFDDDFIFEGSLNSMAKQIGNAVPVKLAQAFGSYFVNHVELWPDIAEGG